MSPSQGKRRTSRGGGGHPAGKRPAPAAAGRPPEAARRLALLVFGVLLAVLLVVVAVAEGIGHPSVPSGDIALVTGLPDGRGNISKAEFDVSLERAARQGGLKTAPKPSDAKYDEFKEAAISSLLDAAWLLGQGAEMGIEPNEEEIANELKKLKNEAFKSEAEYKQFLKKEHYSPAEVNERVELQIITREIEQKLQDEAPKPTSREMKDYYEAAKSTTFTEEPTRDVRLVLNKDKKKAEEAKGELEKDNSAKSWVKVAKKFSEDPSSKGTGGLHRGLTEAAAQQVAGKAIFTAPEGQIEGPVKTKEGKYIVFEVEGSAAERVKSFEESEEQIKGELEPQLSQRAFTAFIADYNSRWQARTFCASGFTIERCANFRGSGHPSEAAPECYEANPKEPPEACPAPVRQAIPALPGTVSLLQPEGQKLAQRPYPEGLKPGEGSGLEGALPTVPPPTTP